MSTHCILSQCIYLHFTLHSLYLNRLYILSETEAQTQSEPEANFYHPDVTHEYHGIIINAV